MLLERITLKNLLSFQDATLELRPLNILIGENTAGKSNLIEAISLLQAAPTDLRSAILRGGGVRNWVSLRAPSPVAEIRCSVRYDLSDDRTAAYQLEMSESAGFIVSEAIFNSAGDLALSRVGNAMLDPSGSLLAMHKSFNDPTPTTAIGQKFQRIRIYREFQTGPRSGSRHGTSTSVPGDFLAEGADNLALVLHGLDFHNVMQRVMTYVNRFSDRIRGVKVGLDQGVAQTHLSESGLLRNLPAVRMSDGTLKFLCLMSVLLHPDPPPLICIDEPEQGLHPDAVRIVADALREASERSQIIVTTHSEALVDAFSDAPEAVVVCERDAAGGTQFRRLSAEKLELWLEKYSLGQLWRNGEIGGTRW